MRVVRGPSRIGLGGLGATGGFDLMPRVVIHSPAGDVVVDPWAGGDGTTASGGTVTIGGVAMPYDIVWGAANLPPADAQVGGQLFMNQLQGYLPLVLLGVGAFLLLKGK